MHFELPIPSMIFDVVLDDGAKICVRRHGRADGVRLLLSHGNGFAADAYFPYWQYLLADFDLVVFDFRNHGQNVPAVPPHHNYKQLARDLEHVVQAVGGSAGSRLSGCSIRCRHARQ
jgi:pimeloyl-ACP methyl ester carboxylesterase